MNTLALRCFASVGLIALWSAYGFSQQRAVRDPLLFGMIHRWQFDGNCYDSVGNLGAKPIGQVAYTEVGNGQGIVFDGATNGFCLPPEKDMQFQASFSISVWVNLKARPSGAQMWSDVIFCGDDRPGLDPYAIQADPRGHIHFLLTGADGSGSSIEAPMPLNQYVHLVATYDKDAGVQSFYMNGVLAGRVSGKKNLTPVVALDASQKPGIGIGTNNDFPKSIYHFNWKGIISDLRIYNRALDKANAFDLYQIGVVKPIRTRINPINP